MKNKNKQLAAPHPASGFSRSMPQKNHKLYKMFKEADIAPDVAATQNLRQFKKLNPAWGSLLNQERYAYIKEHYEFIKRRSRLLSQSYNPNSIKIDPDEQPIEQNLRLKEGKPVWLKRGGLPKKPKMTKGGSYKGKKHSYAAGGMVKELKI
tara:strand:- start:333 stop:785 length:453 start_codon:yes stop_codon:yes gene_type:complete